MRVENVRGAEHLRITVGGVPAPRILHPTPTNLRIRIVRPAGLLCSRRHAVSNARIAPMLWPKKAVGLSSSVPSVSTIRSVSVPMSSMHGSRRRSCLPRY